MQCPPARPPQPSCPPTQPASPPPPQARPSTSRSHLLWATHSTVVSSPLLSSSFSFSPSDPSPEHTDICYVSHLNSPLEPVFSAIFSTAYCKSFLLICSKALQKTCPIPPLPLSLTLTLIWLSPPRRGSRAWMALQRRPLRQRDQAFSPYIDRSIIGCRLAPGKGHNLP